MVNIPYTSAMVRVIVQYDRWVSMRNDGEMEWIDVW